MFFSEVNTFSLSNSDFVAPALKFEINLSRSKTLSLERVYPRPLNKAFFNYVVPNNHRSKI